MEHVKTTVLEFTLLLFFSLLIIVPGGFITEFLYKESPNIVNYFLNFFGSVIMYGIVGVLFWFLLCVMIKITIKVMFK